MLEVFLISKGLFARKRGSNGRARTSDLHARQRRRWLGGFVFTLKVLRYNRKTPQVANLMYKNIQAKTQEMLEEIQEKLAKKDQSSQKKIEKLKKDLKEAQKAKLSLKTQNLIKEEIKSTQHFQKHLQTEGMMDLIGEKCESLTRGQEKILKQMFFGMDALIAKGLNEGVYQKLNLLDNMFESYSTKIKADHKKIIKSNKSASTPASGAVADLDTTISMQQFCQDVLNELSSFKFSTKDNLQASNMFPLKNERAKLAPKCVASARSELRGALNFLGDGEESPSMFAMFVSDAFNHYNLGVQILKGDPKEIDNASSMDTASRDGINGDVWDFCSETIYDPDIFGRKALKEHLEQVKIQEAKKLKRSINRAVGDTSKKKAGSLKKM